MKLINTITLKDIKVESRMLCHMAFETVHLMKYEFTIVAPNNFLNGRKFYKETSTKKRKNSIGSFGKSESIYYFTEDGEIYKTAEDILKSINIEIK